MSMASRNAYFNFDLTKATKSKTVLFLLDPTTQAAMEPANQSFLMKTLKTGRVCAWKSVLVLIYTAESSCLSLRPVESGRRHLFTE